MEDWQLTFYFLFLVPHICILLTYFKFRFGCAGSSLLFRLFSHCSKQGLLFVAVGRLLIELAYLVAEH